MVLAQSTAESLPTLRRGRGLEPQTDRRTTARKSLKPAVDEQHTIDRIQRRDVIEEASSGFVLREP